MSEKRYQRSRIDTAKSNSKHKNTTIAKIKAYFQLHIDNYESSHGRRIEGTLFLFNILAILIFSIETFNISLTTQKFLFISEIIIVSIFIVEYLIRFWVAEKKLKHSLNIYSIIDLISILPILLNFIDFTFLRIYRILRLYSFHFEYTIQIKT